MENSTNHGNFTNTVGQDGTLLARVATFIAALNIFLSITACLGNGMILIALRSVFCPSTNKTVVSMPGSH